MLPTSPRPNLRTRDRGRTWRRAGNAPVIAVFHDPARGVRDEQPPDECRRPDEDNRRREDLAPGRSSVPKGLGRLRLVGRDLLRLAEARMGSVQGATQRRRPIEGPLPDDGRRGSLETTPERFFEPGRVRLGTMHSGYAGGMSFTRGGHGLLWSSRGETLRTSDGGRHWRPNRRYLARRREGLLGLVANDRIGYLLLRDDGRRFDWELLRTDGRRRKWRLVRSWSRR